ncbi:MAG: hypothetical protein M1818_000252 [Claussenomyces sp. TS43310]|nr:MAG: hypothetical protein M1818_000252 [Claussenomyces sp. TS43310]
MSDSERCRAVREHMLLEDQELDRQIAEMEEAEKQREEAVKLLHQMKSEKRAEQQLPDEAREQESAQVQKEPTRSQQSGNHTRENNIAAMDKLSAAFDTLCPLDDLPPYRDLSRMNLTGEQFLFPMKIPRFESPMTSKFPVMGGRAHPSAAIPRDSRRSKQKGPKRDPIVPPSAASGGVPEVNPEYLVRSMRPPEAVGVLQPVLLVMDLNGTLLHRPNRQEPSVFVERPCTGQFLHYVFSNFSVMVWSSARPENVAKMCNQLFPAAQRKALVAEWGRDRLGLSREDYIRRVQVYKRLELVWNDESIQRAHPSAAQGKYWDQSNTILLDDSLEKARSEPHNLLPIPEFCGNPSYGGRRKKPHGEDILRKVAEYLDLVKVQTDVSSFMRAQPFRSENVVVAEDGTLQEPVV